MVREHRWTQISPKYEERAVIPRPVRHVDGNALADRASMIEVGVRA